MKILYVEDDLIDQMTVQRLANKNNFNLTLVASKAEAMQLLKLNHFDFIVLDFNLSDGNALEIVKEISNQDIAILSEPIELSEINTNCTIRFWAKPISQTHIDELFSNQLNLNYFNALTENDISFKLDILKVALKSLPESIEKLHNHLDQKNAVALKFEAHKMKSGARAVGINIVSTLAHLEAISSQENWEELNAYVSQVFERAKHGVDQIKTLIEELEHI